MTDLATGSRETDLATGGRMTDLAPHRRDSLESLRSALNHLFGAERRLRGRDHNRPGELTQAQVRTIAALGREPELTAGQLAKRAELTPATVTTILDQLEAANIIVRSRSTTDRRVCNVSLTPDGWALLERKLAVWQSLWEEAMADFSEEEIDAAARVIGRASDALQALNRKLERREPDPNS